MNGMLQIFKIQEYHSFTCVTQETLALSNYFIRDSNIRDNNFLERISITIKCQQILNVATKYQSSEKRLTKYQSSEEQLTEPKSQLISLVSI